MRFTQAVGPEVAQSVQNAAVRASKGLLIWTVYCRPLDFPDRYVARAHLTEAGQTKPLPFHLEAATLQGLREQLPAGLVCLARQEADEPQIVECWL